MKTSAIKDNDVMYKTNYQRGCLFKCLQLRINLKAEPSIYRVELIDRNNEKILIGGRQLLTDALALYNDLSSLNASEVETAFASMC